jgi:alpha-tubulin suppressor-like RCC1 family protein
VSKSSPIQIGSNTDWASCAAGETQGAAITTSGVLYAWGRNEDGQVGVNDVINRSSPVQVGSGYAMVSAGIDHMLAIKTNGTLWSWGVAATGRLGLNDTIARSSPTQVGALTNWEYVSAGAESSHAIRAGVMYGWGQGNKIGDNATIRRSSPVQIGSATNWTRVASTNENIVGAIRSDGSLWGWGRNENGELGQGNRIPLNASSPIQIGAGRTWTDVDTGDTFMMYLEEP